MGTVKLHYDQFTAFRRQPTLRRAITITAQQIADRANARATLSPVNYKALMAHETQYGIVALATTGRASDSGDHLAYRTMTDQMSYHTLQKAVQ